jgi:hypothetical protein
MIIKGVSSFETSFSIPNVIRKSIK